MRKRCRCLETAQLIRDVHQSCRFGAALFRFHSRCDGHLFVFIFAVPDEPFSTKFSIIYDRAVNSAVVCGRIIGIDRCSLYILGCSLKHLGF